MFSRSWRSGALVWEDQARTNEQYLEARSTDIQRSVEVRALAPLELLKQNVNLGRLVLCAVNRNATFC